MRIDPKTISLLQTFGLTMYDAKAYAALTQIGSTTPFILAEETGIPRTKIYDTIKRLEKQNWITVDKGRPGKITPLSPREVIGSRKAVLNSDIDKMTNEFVMNYENRVEKEPPKANVIHGIDNITHKTIEMMKEARTSLYLFGTLYYPEELEQIKKQIEAAKRRGVLIRISPNNPVRIKGKTLNVFEPPTKVRKGMQVAPEPAIRTLTIDSKETLMMFPLPEAEMADRENLIALWVANDMVVKAINNAFNMMWGNP